MNKKSLLSLTAGTFALFACSDPVVETDGYNSPIETKSKLTVVVEDAVTGKQLKENASVVFPGIVGTQLSTGAFVFDDVYVGNYSLIVSGGTGYATAAASASVGARTNENVHIAYENSVVVKAYPLASSLEGQVYYTNKNGVQVPAAGVQVQLHFEPGVYCASGYMSGSVFICTNQQTVECPLIQKIYEAKAVTSADGKYLFENLPAVGNEVCTPALYAIGGTAGEMPFQTTRLEGGFEFDLASSTTANNSGTRLISQEQNTSVFIVTGYNEVIAANARTTAIEFTFSDDIDMPSVVAGTIDLSSGSEVYDVAWGAKKVTLTPAGKWNNNFTVRFNNLKSVTGKQLNNNATADTYPIIVSKTDISIVPVTGLKLNNHATLLGSATNIKNADTTGNTIDSVKQTDSQFYLTWNKVIGADDGYTVYCKDENMNNYKECAKNSLNAVNGIQENDTAVYVMGLGAIGKKTFSFLVQAKNSQFKTILDEANALVLKDNISPVKRAYYWGTPAVTSPTKDSTFTTEISLGTLATATADYIRNATSTILFPEDMDISAPLTISGLSNYIGPSASVSKVDSIMYEWTGKQNLLIKARVKGAAMAAGLNAQFTITGLKDQNGNKLVVEYVDANTSGTNIVNPISGSNHDTYVKIDTTNVLRVQVTASAPSP